MARITGKNAAIYAVLAKTVVSVAAAMTDGGAHTIYTLVVGSAQKYWNPNLPPTITKDTAGNGVFLAVNPSAYTVDYVNGTVTFLVANGATDVVKIKSIEYCTLQAIGDLFNWTLDLKIGVTDATAFQDAWATKLSTFRSWSASAQGYHVSAYWWDLFMAVSEGASSNECYVVFYPDIGAPTLTNERFIGAATVDLSVEVKKDSPVTEKMTLNGTGAIYKATS